MDGRWKSGEQFNCSTPISRQPPKKLDVQLSEIKPVKSLPRNLECSIAPLVLDELSTTEGSQSMVLAEATSSESSVIGPSTDGSVSMMDASTLDKSEIRKGQPDYSRPEFSMLRDQFHMSVDKERSPPKTSASKSYQCSMELSSILAPPGRAVVRTSSDESSSDDSSDLPPPLAPRSQHPESTTKEALMERKEELMNRLHQLKKALLVAKNLPDNGRRIKDNIEVVTNELKQIENLLPQSAALGNINIGRQPLNEGMVLPHGDNPEREVAEMAKLLTGKIAKDRLEEVKRLTYKTVVDLHKAIEACPKETDECPTPAGVTVELLPHQKQALVWMLWREEQNPSGGILADDMGLGKTLTALSVVVKTKTLADDEQMRRSRKMKSLSADNHCTPSGATLVICPKSVLHQWQNEAVTKIKRGLLNVTVHYGAKREKLASRLSKHDVVLTTYGVLESEHRLLGRDKPGSSPLFGIAWQRIILDEAHIIKEPSTKKALACCALTAVSRWALTGTPLHNQLRDIYSLIKFLRCAPFDELCVWKTWMETKSDVALTRLHSLVSSLLIRRTKQDKTKAGIPLIELPPKTTELQTVRLCRREKDIYDRMFSSSRQHVVSYLGDKGGSWNRFRQPNGQNPWVPQKNGRSAGLKNMQIICMLLRLRQACCHFSLVKQSVEMDALKEDSLQIDVSKQLEDLSLLDTEAEIVPDAVEEVFNASYASSKVRAMMEQLERIRSAQQSGRRPKFVIVSQWVKLLEIISLHLRQKSIKFTSITGSVSAEERIKRIEMFNSDAPNPEVMLLSLTAGGIGLNLIGGNILFITDLHWNPALELQASDRIYRVGQTRPVYVHKFICEGTIEEKVLRLQRDKLELAESVLTGVAAKSLKSLTLNDLRYLFDIETSGNVNPVLKADNAGRGLASMHPRV